MTPYWEPDGPLSEAEIESWRHNATRIATGIAVIAHLEAFVDPTNFRVGFSCGDDVELAKAYEAQILAENIECRRVAPAVAGRDLPATEIVLPCKPFASDEMVSQSVLAAMKASHGLEFETIWDDEEAFRQSADD
ncbi:MAG TPA: hypothetical protein VKZ96_00745 [Thermomicrobiales bacterium]|nr:hypothetical protein [Thermomicrobiales bacterium]